jgi:hypothetical protein
LINFGGKDRDWFCGFVVFGFVVFGFVVFGYVVFGKSLLKRLPDA